VTTTNRWIEAQLVHFDDGTVNVATFLVRPSDPDNLGSLNIESAAAAEAHVRGLADKHGVEHENITLRHIKRSGNDPPRSVRG
jgi:hypothetical protein